MEVLKFKIWDKKNKCWYRSPQLVIRPYSGRITDGAILLEDVEVLQYIKISDINNNKYCEGDIYKYENLNYGYGGKVKEFKYRIFENIEDLYFDDSFEWEMKHGEIIGNKFENPELLKLL